MQSDSAISVRKFNVKPNAVQRDERRDHGDRQREPGDDRAAPAVQEQEDDEHRQERAFDDRRFHAIDARSADSAVELATRISTSAGRRFFSASIAAVMPRPVSTMFASCAFWMSIVIDGRPLIREIEVSSFSPSMTSATCDR